MSETKKDTNQPSLDQAILNAVANQIQSPDFEKVIADAVQTKIKKAVEDIFSYNSDVNKLIQNKIKSLLVPSIEAFDMSKYAEKLEAVLDEILAQTTVAETGNLLRNFKGLMCCDVHETVTVSELFEKYNKFVASDIDTSKLDVIHEDGDPYYASPITHVEVTIEKGGFFRKDENPDYIIDFTCEEDPKLDRRIRAYTSDYSVEVNGHKVGSPFSARHNINVADLRHMDSFELFTQAMYRRFSKIALDTLSEECDDIEVEDTPEISFS